KRGFEKFPRTMQPCLHGFGPNAVKIRRFLDTEAFDGACHQNGPEFLGKQIDLMLKKPANFALRCCAFWVHEMLSREWEGNDVGMRFGRRVDVRDGGIGVLSHA